MTPPSRIPPGGGGKNSNGKGSNNNIGSTKCQRFNKEQQALVDMAKKDKKTGGITKEDMNAYKDLNNELGAKGFPSKKDPTKPGGIHEPVRGPEDHGNGEHGHVGPINHIPIKK